MKTLKYTITFFDYWHLSSVLSAGARLDSTVAKDRGGLPYVPAKTIKGLIREIANILGDMNFVLTCFGGEGIDIGTCYFENASLLNDTAKQILANNLQDNLYDIIASTKIGEKNNVKEIEGLAVDNSLREIEVVVPLVLHGKIHAIPDEYIDAMKKSLSMIKRMGLNRNRGLGRCEFGSFSIEESK